MMSQKDNPGVYVPPPMIYAAFFGLASFVQSKLPINFILLRSDMLHIIGWLLILVAAGLILTSLWRFWLSKNTLITIRSANSLQTNGIYAYTRNPMYLALLILYIGLACFFGNCWTFIFLLLLFFIIQHYVIGREEKYLNRTFRQDYTNYKVKVRRWIWCDCLSLAPALYPRS